MSNIINSMNKYIRNSLIFAIILVAISAFYVFVLRPIINDKKLDKCLELAGRGEIEGQRRDSLGYDKQKYYDNCYKRY